MISIRVALSGWSDWTPRCAMWGTLAMLAACASEPLPMPTAAQLGQVSTPPPSVAWTPPAGETTKNLPEVLPPPPAVAAAMSVLAVDPLEPEVKVDLDNPAIHTDLWVRVRKGYGIPDLNGDLVRKWEQFYASKPDYVARMTERGGRYLYHIVDEAEKRGIPTDIALLPFIESAFNPQAQSVARASGMWQFIPSTGKDFSLRQNVFRDDRRDVLASTRAALDYLQGLQRMFGDWQLALAAYNWGQGSVQRAIDRNRKQGLGTSYSDLRMPDETRNYVPKLQAVKNIVARPQDYGLTLPKLDNHPYFLSVSIERDIDVALAAKLAKLSLEDFQSLNPQMNKPVILASGTPQVLLPFDNAREFVRQVPEHRGMLASWTAWVVPTTMRPAEAAKQAGMSETQLREVNRIPPRMLVKAGSTLLVPRSVKRDVDVAPHLADNATLALAPERPPLRKVTFKAGKKGDSVAAVAKRYRVTTAAVAQWNGVAANATFGPGKLVVVMVPNAPARRAAVGHATRANSRPAVKGRRVAHK